ncbi:hypothetical protein [Nocardioides sp. WS12]|uniref:hypothetical protein n=1 Tax=Nocardioides sp. WS12 TaxID=2486272 RepID=UPI0015F92EDA|nr:hypothetical protein [Nocardioides sp. WS12]
MSTYDAARRNARVAADRRKRIALAQLRGEPIAPIDAAPLRIHIKALIGLGWSGPAILAASNVNASVGGLLLIANGRSMRAERKFAPILDLPISVGVPESVPDQMFVPSLGSARRIRALMALGWRHEDITSLLGGRVSHHLAAHRHKAINAHDWRLVDAAYEALSGSPGPSQLSRKRAAEQGYVPPLAWDDIDDPNERRTTETLGSRRVGVDLVLVKEVLAGAYRLDTSPAEKAEVVRLWEADGKSLAELERLTGWNTNRYRPERTAS